MNRASIVAIALVLAGCGPTTQEREDRARQEASAEAQRLLESRAADAGMMAREVQVTRTRPGAGKGTYVVCGNVLLQSGALTTPARFIYLHPGQSLQLHTNHVVSERTRKFKEDRNIKTTEDIEDEQFQTMWLSACS